MIDFDDALHPPAIIPAPGDATRFAARHRQWQGIPTLERTAAGRLWAAWYSGGPGEGHENFVILSHSDDDGATWSPPVLAIAPEGYVRAYDPCLWIDPRGRLWLFWAQSFGQWDGRAGVWAIVCDQPDTAQPAWSAPRRLTDGIMMNKPTVLRDGTWVLCAAVWTIRPFTKIDAVPDVPAANLRFWEKWAYPNLALSADEGKTWRLERGPDVPQRSCDEHMLIERRDGSWWLLVRTRYGIGQSVSTDRGRTWTAGSDSGMGGPDSRFFIRRLRSDNLLLINHHNFTGRSHLTAALSDDDGATWRGRLLLDERQGVSYPDAVEAENGLVYAIYDFDRHGAKRIYLAIFSEPDVAAGRAATDRVRLRAPVDQAG